VKSAAVNRRRALRDGALTYLNDSSATRSGKADGSSPAQVDVTVDTSRGTFEISPSWTDVKGKQHTVTCLNEKCSGSDDTFSVVVAWGLPLRISGKLDDPNHIRGTRTEVKDGVGRAKNGKATWTVTWDLSRP